MVKEADVLLGILDGQKIIKALNNDKKAQSWIINELDGILTLLGKEHQKKQPIHFVISKWDLLNSKYTVLEIHEMLMKIPNFKAFVKNVYINEGLVRLIPISSVGFNFINYEKSNGQMIIKEDGILEPYQVEYPIALALLDKFRVHYDSKLREYREKEIDIEREIEQSSFSWKNFWGGILKSVGSFFEDTEVFESLGRYWRVSGEMKVEDARNELQELSDRLRSELNQVEDEQSAIQYAINAFYEIQLKLDVDFPGSLIKN
ncbi:hypothetical protein DMA11_22645 [Marinilabiliaceae bacterium JC017]|nr:hypothetical protein DMA11_22645 [Marinilabiliaceae bacterium JC017]